MNTDNQHQYDLEIIQVRPDATAGALLARLEIARGPVVALSFADDEFPLPLTETLPWMALRRKAMQRGLGLVVVAPKSKEARRMGEQAGIPAVRSLDDAGRIRQNGSSFGAYPMGMPVLWDGHQRTASLWQARQRFGRTKPLGKRPEPGWSVAPWLSNAVLFLWLVVMTMVLGATVLVLVPSANVVLVPQRHSISINVPMAADIGLSRTDFAQVVVPARSVVVDVEGTGELAPTGRRLEPDAKATGRVTFTNRRAQAVTIPAGTIVATSSGTNLRFQTLEDVTLPAGVGATASTPIEALSPGPIGNVRAFAINSIQGSLSLVAQVVNEAPTTGGTFKEVSIVTQADKDNLLLATERQLQTEAYRRLSEVLREGEFVPPESVGTLRLSENFDHFVDEQADRLQVRLRIRARGLAVDGNAARLIAQSRLQELVPADGRLLASGLRIEPGTVTSASLERVQFSMMVSALYVRPLPVSKIRDTLYRVPIAIAPSLLMEHYPIETVRKIEVTPNWYAKGLGLMPILPARIYVQVDYNIGETGP